MPTFRKKPVEIEAFLWEGEWEPFYNWLVSLNDGEDIEIPFGSQPTMTRNSDGSLEINTLEGVMTAEIGVWVIRGVQGEFYPCQPDIFEATYDAADGERKMHQEAPYPDILADLVKQLDYRPGWQMYLTEDDFDRGQGSKGLTFIAIGQYPDSYHLEQTIRVSHYFPVPPAAYNEASWRRWLLDRILEIERHEACEFFQIDGERPYAPHHGPGNDPYIVFDHGSDVERRTSFRGDVKSE